MDWSCALLECLFQLQSVLGPIRKSSGNLIIDGIFHSGLLESILAREYEKVGCNARYRQIYIVA